jgi:hypothetical protein
MSNDYHVGREHAVFTEDQTIWQRFYGDVPRVGDMVAVETLNGPKIGKVQCVTWHVLKWFKDEKQKEEVHLSAARVLIELVNE